MGQSKIRNSLTWAHSPSSLGLNRTSDNGWAVHIGPLGQKAGRVSVYTRYTFCVVRNFKVSLSHTSSTGPIEGAGWAAHHERRAIRGPLMLLNLGPNACQIITMWITMHIVISSGTVSIPFSGFDLTWA